MTGRVKPSIKGVVCKYLVMSCTARGGGRWARAGFLFSQSFHASGALVFWLGARAPPGQSRGQRRTSRTQHVVTPKRCSFHSSHSCLPPLDSLRVIVQSLVPRDFIISRIELRGNGGPSPGHVLSAGILPRESPARFAVHSAATAKLSSPRSAREILLDTGIAFAGIFEVSSEKWARSNYIVTNWARESAVFTESKYCEGARAICQCGQCLVWRVMTETE